jgi:type 1 fimbriae regulatory protein FimE
VARKNRKGARDAAAIWLAFNHGLRVSELCDLRWQDIQWQERRIMIRRLKRSQTGEHPLTEQDKRFLGALRTPGLRPF